jgi:nickel-type superoxide dismutase maturation protease
MQPRQLWNKGRVAATRTGLQRSLALIAGLVFVAAILRALGGPRLSRYIVRGASMEPTLRDGDRLLVLHGVHHLVAPQVGEIVMARPHAISRREVVKRVARVERRSDGVWFTLLGDCPVASTDSRHFGPVSRGELIGRVWLRYWPDDRRGPVRHTIIHGEATPRRHPV